MYDRINNLFQLKKQEGFIGKEIAKEEVNELMKNYKHEFPKRGNPQKQQTSFCQNEEEINKLYIQITRAPIY